MNYFLAEFEPGILFLLLWGLLSWLTSKKRKKPKRQGEKSSTPIADKEDIFARLRKLQDHLAQEVDIFPKKSDEEVSVVPEEEIPPTEIDPGIEIEEDPTGRIDGHKIQSLVQVDKKENWVKDVLKQKAQIKRAIIMNEILGQPRAIHPYQGEFYDA